MNGKHTIKQSDWWNYPVLQKGEYSSPFRFYREDRTTAEVNVGLQDNIPVLGCIWYIPGESSGNGGGGFAPGRKWGEFRSLKEAELYGLRYLLEKFQAAEKQSKSTAKRTRTVINEIQKRIAELSTGTQLKLF